MEKGITARGQAAPRGTHIRILTLFHHPDVHAALQPTRLAVPPVVLGDFAVTVEGTREHRFPLHTSPGEEEEKIFWVK